MEFQFYIFSFIITILLKVKTAIGNSSFMMCDCDHVDRENEDVDDEHES